jgi:two-component sensor histidine kinase
VQSIASQTLRNAASTGQAKQVFESRLLALSRAHDVLTRENWDGASLREIVTQAVEPYRSDAESAFTTGGPEVRLSTSLALALAMALQELVTNAVKYGSLSRPGGQVRVTWDVHGDGAQSRLKLRWEERLGPPVKEPERRGFGSRLIERSLAQDPNGRVRLIFAPAGLTCEFEATAS